MPSLPATAAPLDLSPEAAYAALQAHDARFDGRLFVGVTSTGIYCRPVCRVRTPQPANCRFFASHAQAEGAGFRPCLKCRPEIAPGLSHTDSSRTLAQAAAAMLRRAVAQGEPVALPAVAARLGVTDRHLRRIFLAEHGVTPQAHLTVQRLLLAKQLLTDTRLPVQEVALAAGFGSTRRLQAALAAHSHVSPRRLRAEGAEANAATQTTRLRLAWRPPYDLAGTLAFFARRAVPGLEQVRPDAARLTRSLAVTHAGRRHEGWLACTFVPARCEVELAVSDSLAPALAGVLPQVRQALDLDARPDLIAPALAGVPGPDVPGLRLPGGFDGFEAAVRVILGQRVTVAAARTLTARLVAALGRPLPQPAPEGGPDRLFPEAAAVACAPAEVLGRLGIVRQRVGALQALAREVTEGRLELHPGAPLDATLEALHALPGIGAWTAQLIALRALAWPDAWPASDLALLKALGTPDAREAAARAESWRPWRAYALMKLWRADEIAA